MQLFSYGSCDARLGRLVTLGHLILLFLLQGSPATEVGLGEIAEAGAGVTPRLARSSTMPRVDLKNKGLGLRRTSSMPQRTLEKDIPKSRSNLDIDAKQLRTPPPPHVPSHEGPSYVPSSQSEQGKESSFWARLSSIWASLKRILGFGPKSSSQVSDISSLPNVSGEARNIEETARDESKQNSWTLSGLWNMIAHKRFYATPVRHPTWPSSVRDGLTTSLGLQGPWEQWSTMVFNPRPPTDVNLDSEISSVQNFGKKLLANEQEALQVWKEKLKEEKNSDFTAEILSTDLFLQLARQLSTQQDKAYKLQKDIIQIGKDATKAMGSPEALKSELRSIVKFFNRAEKQAEMGPGFSLYGNPDKQVYSVIGTKYDTDYYQRPLSPILLLYENKYIPSELAGYAEVYHEAVQHFQKTRSTIAAVKDYIEEAKKVTPIHENYSNEVLNYFREFDKVKAKDNKYLENMGKTGLSPEDKQATWDGTFNPPEQSHHD